ncbi:hypothetical protein HanRHA438_Chr12g0549371 [Helianthus annuus]|nr:hypothetical protein HanRHA438_Chr12g0549371 [Helianthus annuus]
MKKFNVVDHSRFLHHRHASLYLTLPLLLSLSLSLPSSCTLSLSLSTARMGSGGFVLCVKKPLNILPQLYCSFHSFINI